MRIAFLTRYDFPYFGPMENFLRMWVLGLKEHEVSCSVVRFSGNLHSLPNDLDIPLYNYLTSNKVRNSMLRPLVFMLKWIMIPFFVIRCKWMLKSDYLVLVGFESAVMIAPLLFWSKCFQLPIIRTHTEIFPEDQYAPKWYLRPKVWVRKIQFRLFDRFMSAHLVMSTRLKQILLDGAVEEKTICHIPHFIDTAKAASQPNGAGSGVFRIGFSGTPNETNGLRDLVEAFFMLPDKIKYAELLVLGKITTATHQVISAHKPSRHRRLLIVGRVDSRKVHSYLMNCSVLVNPRKSGISAETGFPTKVGEYLVTGKPVITSRCGDLTKFLQHGQNVLFCEPDNPSSLSETITSVYDNTSLMKEVGLSGQLWAREHLDYATNAKRFKDFVVTL